MFCKNCGTQLADGTKFCPNCGSSTDPNAPVVAAPAAAPQAAPAPAPKLPKIKLPKIIGAAHTDKYSMPIWKILYLAAAGATLISMIFFFLPTLGTSFKWGDETLTFTLTELMEGGMELEGWGNLTWLGYVIAMIIPALPFIPLLKFKFQPSKLLAIRIVTIWSLSWMIIGFIYNWVNLADTGMTMFASPTVSIVGIFFLLFNASALVLTYVCMSMFKKAVAMEAATAQPAPAPVQ